MGKPTRSGLDECAMTKPDVSKGPETPQYLIHDRVAWLLVTYVFKGCGMVGISMVATLFTSEAIPHLAWQSYVILFGVFCAVLVATWHVCMSGSRSVMREITKRAIEDLVEEGKLERGRDGALTLLEQKTQERSRDVKD